MKKSMVKQKDMAMYNLVKLFTNKHAQLIRMTIQVTLQHVMIENNL